MSELLNKETVKRVKESLNKFDTNLKIIVLDSTARSAKEAANSLKCELGAIIKSLVFRAESDFMICLISGDKRCSLNKLKKISQIQLIEILTMGPRQLKQIVQHRSLEICPFKSDLIY